MSKAYEDTYFRYTQTDDGDRLLCDLKPEHLQVAEPGRHGFRIIVMKAGRVIFSQTPMPVNPSVPVDGWRGLTAAIQRFIDELPMELDLDTASSIWLMPETLKQSLKDAYRRLGATPDVFAAVYATWIKTGSHRTVTYEEVFSQEQHDCAPLQADAKVMAGRMVGEAVTEERIRDICTEVVGELVFDPDHR